MEITRSTRSYGTFERNTQAGYDCILPHHLHKTRFANCLRMLSIYDKVISVFVLTQVVLYRNTALCAVFIFVATGKSKCLLAAEAGLHSVVGLLMCCLDSHSSNIARIGAAAPHKSTSLWATCPINTAIVNACLLKYGKSMVRSSGNIANCQYVGDPLVHITKKLGWRQRHAKGFRLILQEQFTIDMRPN